MLCSMASLLLLLSPMLVESSPPAHLDALRYAVQEEVPVGTRVGNVVADRGIRRQYGKDVLSQLEFRFLSEPSLPLVIGLNDGVIRTSGVIDREALPACRQRETCEIPVDVTVQPVAYFQIIKIIVEVRS
jgi:Cadherin-like